jgi:2-dehydro-3-deoxygalactonokinase
MTGELFSIIKQNSILKEGIAEIDNRNSLTIKNRKAFFGGVEKSIDTNLLRTLFSVRINHIFERLNGIENYYYLSGLLIGSELRGISKAGGRIMLCSNIKTSYLYELAINIIGLKKVTTIVPPNIVDSAAFEGHISILKKQLKTSEII